MPNDGMTPSWKKWPGMTDWVHGRPVPDPGDEKNFKYIEKMNEPERPKKRTVKDALKKPKASGNVRGGGSVSTGAGSLANRRGIKKLMENL